MARKVGAFMATLNDSQRALLTATGERVIAVRPSMVKALGGRVSPAVLLSQFIYWTGITQDPEGWFYNTQEELEDQTGISADAQARARKLLVARGLLEEKRAGCPARLYYRLNVMAVVELLEGTGGQIPENQETAERGIKIPRNAETGYRETRNLYKDKKIPEKIPENTQCARVSSILKTIGKETAWQMGTIGALDRRKVEAFAAELDVDGKPADYLETFAANWPTFWAGKKSSGPPTLAQVITHHAQCVALSKPKHEPTENDENIIGSYAHTQRLFREQEKMVADWARDREKGAGL